MKLGFKMHVKNALGFLMLVLCITFAGTFGGAKVEAASLSQTSITVPLEKSTSVTLNNAKGNIKWSCSNNKALLINAYNGGKSLSVYGLKVGTYKVHAKNGGKTYTCTINVKYIPALSLNGRVVSKGSSFNLVFGNSKAAPTWSVSDKSILKLKKWDSKTVEVFGKKRGTAYVYAKLNGKTYKCKVVVE